MIKSLEAGEWRPGDAIPSEAELAARFNVSQGTARKAIDELAAENLLVRRQGKGTFVATHSDPRSFFRFLRLVPDSGVLSTYCSEPLSCQLQPAQEDVARILRIAPGESVLAIERLLKFEQKAVVADKIQLLAGLFDGLTLERLKSSERSLYSLYESAFGVRMIRAEEHLRAVLADAPTAAALGVEVGCPLLLVERLAYTYGNKPVEWRRGYYCTHEHHYFNELF
ncbi:MAG: transcriptional regulator, GntR family [Proteobacteria bacterium]|nr:transcriptional regulator, GntR family [Pseudomonadota bacterium]